MRVWTFDKQRHCAIDLTHSLLRRNCFLPLFGWYRRYGTHTPPASKEGGECAPLFADAAVATLASPEPIPPPPLFPSLHSIRVVRSRLSAACYLRKSRQVYHGMASGIKIVFVVLADCDDYYSAGVKLN